MVFEDDECLTLALERRLGDDVEDGTIIAEQIPQCIDDDRELRALVDVMDLDMLAALCNAAKIRFHQVT